MVSSIDSKDDSMQMLMMQMFQKMKTADTDGTKGLSKDELSSIDAGSDVGGSAFLKSLTDQFDTLDADGNGQLTSDEIAKAHPREPMGPLPGMNLSSSASSSSENKLSELGDSLGNLASSFLDKLINTYKDGGLSNLTSSLNLST